MITRSDYIEKMKQQLDGLNARMAEAETAASEATLELRHKYDAEVSKLRVQSKLAVAKFDELKSAGDESWQSMVDEMDKVLGAFIHSFHYFKSQI
jgi:hypothetical protein